MLIPVSINSSVLFLAAQNNRYADIKGVDYHFERPEKGDAELKIWEVSVNFI